MRESKVVIFRGNFFISHKITVRLTQKKAKNPYEYLKQLIS